MLLPWRTYFAGVVGAAGEVKVLGVEFSCGAPPQPRTFDVQATLQPSTTIPSLFLLWTFKFRALALVAKTDSSTLWGQQRLSA